jgi:hypothetical protein
VGVVCAAAFFTVGVLVVVVASAVWGCFSLVCHVRVLRVFVYSLLLHLFVLGRSGFCDLRQSMLMLASVVVWV